MSAGQRVQGNAAGAFRELLHSQVYMATQDLGVNLLLTAGGAECAWKIYTW